MKIYVPNGGVIAAKPTLKHIISPKWVMCPDYRRQQRRNDDHDGHCVHKTAYNQEENVAQEEEYIFVAGQRQQQAGELRGNGFPGHVVAEQIGRAENQHNGSGGIHCLHQNLRQLPQFQFLIDKLADKERVKSHQHAAFRGRANAETQRHNQTKRYAVYLELVGENHEN